MTAVILSMDTHRAPKGHNSMEEGETQSSIAWQWRWDVLRSDMAAHTKLVLLVASFHGDADGSNIRPSLTTLSKLCSLDERTVKKARDAGKGWLKISKAGRGRGKATEYKLTIPRETLTELAALTAKKGASQVPFYEGKGAQETPFADEKGAPQVPFYGEKGAPEAPFCDEKGDTQGPLLGDADHAEKGAPGAVKGGAGRPPTCPVPVTTLHRAREGCAEELQPGEAGNDVSHDDLLNALLEASDGRCNPNRHYGLEVLSTPRSWIANGCSLSEDIIPAIRLRCRKKPLSSIATWEYFQDAVLMERDKRKQALPEPVDLSSNAGNHSGNYSNDRRSKSCLVNSIIAKRKMSGGQDNAK